jgi:hypothetical protein
MTGSELASEVATHINLPSDFCDILAVTPC